MPTKSLEICAGYYGKIPARGDFVKHQLPRSFIEPWDDWLQAAIHKSREQLGESWLDAYLTSPFYRFLLSSGLCGNKQWMGVFMPSVDQVGRYFPLTLCVALPQSKNAFSALQTYQKWFEQAEQLVASCLEDEFDMNAFNQSVTELSITAESGTEYELKPNSAGSNTRQILIRQAAESLQNIHQVYPEILDTTLKQTCFAYSLWSTQGSENLSSSLLISQGLPAIDAFQALFTGDWENSGWLNSMELSGLNTTNCHL